MLAKLLIFFFSEAPHDIQSVGWFVAVYQHKKRGDKYVISQIDQFPLSFLWDQGQNQMEVVTKVSLWERIKKSSEGFGQVRLPSESEVVKAQVPAKKVKIQVQVLMKAVQEGLQSQECA